MRLSRHICGVDEDEQTEERDQAVSCAAFIGPFGLWLLLF